MLKPPALPPCTTTRFACPSPNWLASTSSVESKLSIPLKLRLALLPLTGHGDGRDEVKQEPSQYGRKTRVQLESSPWQVYAGGPPLMFPGGGPHAPLML